MGEDIYLQGLASPPPPAKPSEPPPHARGARWVNTHQNEHPHLLSWLAMHCACFSRPELASRLVRRFGSPHHILTQTQDALLATQSEWTAITALRDAVDDDAAQRMLRDCRRQDITVLTLDDAAYPTMLREIPDPPLVLFVRGDAGLLHRAPSVAIVGSRKATEYGRELAHRIAQDLSAAGVVVISGLAFGIDAEAHRGTLADDGCTIGVLASGVDRITPRSHYGLGHDILKNGALCSEFPLGTPSYSSNYPQRNRLISGLSFGVLIVESTRASGTMWTARHAVEQGRLLFAVPGQVGHPLSAGPHALLRDGAMLVESAKHILTAIRPLCNENNGLQSGTGQTKSSSGMGRDLLDWFASPRALVAIVEKVGGETAAVMAWLTQMEMQGQLATNSKGLYQRYE